MVIQEVIQIRCYRGNIQEVITVEFGGKEGAIKHFSMYARMGKVPYVFNKVS